MKEAYVYALCNPDYGWQNLAKKFGIKGSLNELGREFKSVEEMEAEYYKTHDCLSDDSDEENARIERWVDDNNYTLND